MCNIMQDNKSGLQYKTTENGLKASNKKVALLQRENITLGFRNVYPSLLRTVFHHLFEFSTSHSVHNSNR